MKSEPKRFAALPSSLPPRGMHRETAAAYIGVSISTFDKMVSEGQMPKPFAVGARRIWDRRKIDIAFDNVSGFHEDGANDWD